MLKPEQQMVLAPFGVSDLISPLVLNSIVIGGGLVLKFVFEGEIWKEAMRDTLDLSFLQLYLPGGIAKNDSVVRREYMIKNLSYAD